MTERQMDTRWKDQHRASSSRWAMYCRTTSGSLPGGANTRLDLFRRAASYVDRILRGAKPADLPVQLPTKFHMAVNLKTAKALGLAVPPSILLRATQMIE